MRRISRIFCLKKNLRHVHTTKSNHYVLFLFSYMRDVALAIAIVVSGHRAFFFSRAQAARETQKTQRPKQVQNLHYSPLQPITARLQAALGKSATAKTNAKRTLQMAV